MEPPLFKPMAPLSAEEKQALVRWVIDTLIARMMDLRPGEFPSDEQYASVLESALKDARKRPPKWWFLADEVDAHVRGLGYSGPKAVMKACEHLTKEDPETFGRNPKALKVRYYENKRYWNKIEAYEKQREK